MVMTTSIEAGYDSVGSPSNEATTPPPLRLHGGAHFGTGITLELIHYNQYALACFQVASAGTRSPAQAGFSDHVATASTSWDTIPCAASAPARFLTGAFPGRMNRDPPARRRPDKAPTIERGEQPGTHQR